MSSAKPVESRDPLDQSRSANHEVKAVGLAVAITVVIVIVLLGAWRGMLALTAAQTPIPPIYRVAAQHGVSPAMLADGRQVFAAACAVCHGRSAEGIPKLGKPLRNNPFVQSLSDADLLTFVTEGRLPTDPANTTGVPMPARGGNPKITDRNLRGVVAYLRVLQDPDAPPTNMDAWTGANATAGATALGGPGHDAFIASCSACHGPSGEGMAGLGKPLANSPFVSAKTDAELMTFVKQGRPIWDPANTTGLDMPPKGGNPALGDEQLKQIVEYIRTLHAQQASGTE